MGHDPLSSKHSYIILHGAIDLQKKKEINLPELLYSQSLSQNKNLKILLFENN